MNKTYGKNYPKNYGKAIRDYKGVNTCLGSITGSPDYSPNPNFKLSYSGKPSYDHQKNQSPPSQLQLSGEMLNSEWGYTNKQFSANRAETRGSRKLVDESSNYSCEQLMDLMMDQTSALRLDYQNMQMKVVEQEMLLKQAYEFINFLKERCQILEQKSSNLSQKQQQPDITQKPLQNTMGRLQEDVELSHGQQYRDITLEQTQYTMPRFQDGRAVGKYQSHYGSSTAKKRPLYVDQFSSPTLQISLHKKISIEQELKMTQAKLAQIQAKSKKLLEEQFPSAVQELKQQIQSSKKKQKEQGILINRLYKIIETKNKELKDYELQKTRSARGRSTNSNPNEDHMAKSELLNLFKEIKDKVHTTS